VGVVLFEVFLCTSYLWRSTFDAIHHFVDTELLLSFSTCVFRFVFIRLSSEYCDCPRPHCKYFESVYRGNECTSALFFVSWLQTVIHGMSLLIMPQDAEIVTSFCACSSTVFPGGIFFLFYWPKYEQVGAVVHCASLLVGNGNWRTLIG